MRTNHTDLKNVIAIARGDDEKMNRYLHQFIDLVSSRSEHLKDAVTRQDRAAIRKILHNMRPQIQFFEVDGIVPSIERLELEYLNIPLKELNRIVDSILRKLQKAVFELKELMDK